MSRRLSCVAIVLGLLAPGFAQSALAHAFAPALLELKEISPEKVEVRFKQPAVRAAGSALRPILPEACQPSAPPTASEEGTGLVASWSLDCAGGLVGQTLGVSGIAGSQANVLVRIELPDGRSIRHVLTLDRPTLVVPEREGVLSVLVSYGRLGFEHIMGGFDHLLFVFGLVLLVGGGWRLGTTITAFTVGHSVTLALAALGVLQVPQAPVEVLIAASIFILAVELTRPAQKRWGSRGSFAMAAGFGLLHGLGFAGALREAGLPQGDVPAALLAFNLGIELGQLGFVGCVLLVSLMARRVIRGLALESVRPRSFRSFAFARAVPVYSLGVLAAFWTFERLAGVWVLFG